MLNLANTAGSYSSILQGSGSLLSTDKPATAEKWPPPLWTVYGGGFVVHGCMVISDLVAGQGIAFVSKEYEVMRHMFRLL